MDTEKFSGRLLLFIIANICNVILLYIYINFAFIEFNLKGIPVFVPYLLSGIIVSLALVMGFAANYFKKGWFLYAVALTAILCSFFNDPAGGWYSFKVLVMQLLSIGIGVFILGYKRIA